VPAGTLKHRVSRSTAAQSGTCERKLRQLASVPVLIVDNFALKPLRSLQDEDFHDLIAVCYENAATITSDLDFSEWGDAFASNRILGAATLGRLRHSSMATASGPRNPCPKPTQPGLRNQQKHASLNPFESALYPRFCCLHGAAHPRRHDDDP